MWLGLHGTALARSHLLCLFKSGVWVNAAFLSLLTHIVSFFWLPTIPANIHIWGKRGKLQPHRWRTVWGHWSCSDWFPGPSVPPRTLCEVTSPLWMMGWRLKCASANCCSPPDHIWHSLCLQLLGAVWTQRQRWTMITFSIVVFLLVKCLRQSEALVGVRGVGDVIWY